MRILLITPAPPKSRAGNRTTALRWRNILRSLGHRVDVSTAYEDQDPDLLIALHAWRSADAVAAFVARYPDRPLLVAITGTDAYRFIHTHPEQTLQSIRSADLLVGLHDLIAQTLPEDQRYKMNVIYQSAEPIAHRQPCKRYFHVCVVGHLREEKDPLRPAFAARQLPADSRIRINQYGKASSEDWAELANAEMQTNERYLWHGEVPRYQIRQVYRRTNLLVLPSRMEGGANVISEAVAAGVPVIASDIAGSIGLLGGDYPGYYPMGDEQALAEVLQRAEADPAFYRSLVHECIAKQPCFTFERETQGWASVLDKLDKR